MKRNLTHWLCAPALVLAALPYQALGAAAAEKAARELEALTPENVAARVTIKDDDLEASAIFTTEPVYQERRGLLGNVPNDSFVRAFVDKRTGTATWQVYVVTNYIGSWRFFEQANFQTSNGVETVPVTVIDRQVQTCLSSSDCVYTEQVGFTLSDELARALGHLYAPNGQLAIWRFRLKAKSGEDFTDGFAVAEVAGIIKAVDDWRALHPPKGPAAPTQPSSTALAPDAGKQPAPLGVQFVPSQFGAVIVTVAPGGLAAAAGFAPGMIVTSVNGKALAGLSLPEMLAILAQRGTRTFSIVGKPDLIVK